MKTTYTLINDNDYAFISRHETLTEARNAARAFNKLGHTTDEEYEFPIEAIITVNY